MRLSRAGAGVALAILIAIGGHLTWERWTGRGFVDGPWPDRAYFETATVPSEEAVRRRILDESPELRRALSADDSLGAIRALRGWAAANMDLNGGDADYWLRLPRTLRTLPNMLHLFDENLLGVQCGQGSRFLKGVYELFGYEAVHYNSGVYFLDSERLHLNTGKTHVISLVRISDGARELWVPEDILFDSEYRIPGEPVSDFSDIIALLKANPAARIERVIDEHRFSRDRNQIAKAAISESRSFSELLRHIDTRRAPDRFKDRWDHWIPQEGVAARLLRQVLNYEGRIYPYHLFLFPIGRNRGVPAIEGLVAMADAYHGTTDVAAPPAGGI